MYLLPSPSGTVSVYFKKLLHLLHGQGLGIIVSLYLFHSYILSKLCRASLIGVTETPRRADKSLKTSLSPAFSSLVSIASLRELTTCSLADHILIGLIFFIYNVCSFPCIPPFSFFYDSFYFVSIIT